MFIVTVSVIHRWLCSSTNYNSTRCHIPTPPAKCIYRHTISLRDWPWTRTHRSCATVYKTTGP